METNVKPASVVKATISDIDMAGLLNLAGLKPDKTSPFALLSAKASASDNRRLQQAGLIDAGNRPTSDCLEALNILANPDVELDLLWGGPDRVSLSKVYFSTRSSKLVSFTRSNPGSNLSFFLSFQDITDLISEKTAFTPVKEAVGLYLESAPSVLPVFLSVLDLYRESQLKAALERRQETALAVTADEVTRIWQESKMETNFSWYDPAGFVAIANSLPVSNIREGLDILKRQLILHQDGTLNTPAAAFASNAFPLMSFVGVKATARKGAAIEKAHLALLRGFATLLFVQITGEAGREQVSLKSITTTELPELLFNLVIRPFEMPAQPAVSAPLQPSGGAVACGKCGESNPGGAKFCVKCGTSMAAAAPAARFCAKCGNAVKPGGKFCEKCGNKLA